MSAAGCERICVANELGAWLDGLTSLVELGANFFIGQMQPWNKTPQRASAYLNAGVTTRSTPFLAGGRCTKRKHRGEVHLITIGNKTRVLEAEQWHRDLMCFLDFPNCPPAPFGRVYAVDDQPFRLPDADGQPVHTSRHSYVWAN